MLQQMFANVNGLAVLMLKYTFIKNKNQQHKDNFIRLISTVL